MADQRQYKRALLQKKQQILSRGGGAGRPRLSPFRDTVTELSLADNHPADLGRKILNVERIWPYGSNS